MNGQFIQRARLEIVELQRKRAAQTRHEKLEATENRTEAELFLDDLVAEGIDLKTPAGIAIAIRAWALKQGEPLQSDELPDDWDPGRPFCD
jgi:hypothetical protein